MRRPNGVDFVVTSGATRLPVDNTGSPPQLFQPNIPVIAVGHFAGPVFVSDQILVKHSLDLHRRAPGSGHRTERHQAMTGRAGPPAARRRPPPVNGALGHTGVLLGFVAAVVGDRGHRRGPGPGPGHRPCGAARSTPRSSCSGGVIAVVAMEHALITHDFSLSLRGRQQQHGTPRCSTRSPACGRPWPGRSCCGGWCWAATPPPWCGGSAGGRATSWWPGPPWWSTWWRPSSSGSCSGRPTRSTHVVGAIPANGPGPNSLLQDNPLVLIHPPMLYLGLVGFTLPFAFAIASLITGRLDEDWQGETRRWTLFAWAFLTDGHPARGLVVLPGARLGRVLGVGPGGERRPAARGWWAPPTSTR